MSSDVLLAGGWIVLLVVIAAAVMQMTVRYRRTTNLASPHGPPVLRVMPPSALAAQAAGGAAAVLTVTPPGGAPATPPPARPTQVDPRQITGRHQAVIDISGGTLPQIEAAIIANAHAVDPHPDNPGEFVQRHPVALEGTPAELDVGTVRALLSNRYPWVSPEPPEAA